MGSVFSPHSTTNGAAHLTAEGNAVAWEGADDVVVAGSCEGEDVGLAVVDDVAGGGQSHI